MPEPSHPPYNIVQPRQLVRWLDINSQNGQLSRSRYNVVIPATPGIIYNSPNLLTPGNWIGPLPQGAQQTTSVFLSPGNVYFYIAGNSDLLYRDYDIPNGVPVGNPIPPGLFVCDSNTSYIIFGQLNLVGTPCSAQIVQVLPTIVGAYDYVASQPFHLTQFKQIVAPNCTLCISYANSDNTGARYIIGSNTLKLLPNSSLLSTYPQPLLSSVPMYTNQLIKPKFRIEFWASIGNTALLTNPITIITSIHSNQDYRYNSDNLINPASALLLNFTSPNLNFPITFPSFPTLNT